MVGHIGKTQRTLDQSLRFALSLPLKDLTVQINTPMPGTPQYEQYREHGTLLTDDLSRYTYFQPVFVPHGLSARQLVAAHRRFYRRFYLRPITLLRHLRSIRRFSDLGKYLRALPLLWQLALSRRDSIR
ncbi:MAG: hypothetical protein P9M14_13975 [Candidatus Alcyoniella australis]|nr:hypothetical protein [Candidatus Alcyoniella australis]